MASTNAVAAKNRYCMLLTGGHPTTNFDPIWKIFWILACDMGSFYNARRVMMRLALPAGVGLREFSTQHGGAGLISRSKLMQLSKAELINRVKNLGLQVLLASAMYMLCAQPVACGCPFSAVSIAGK